MSICTYRRVLFALAFGSLPLAAPARAGDFDGDGTGDLAIACSREWVAGLQVDGAVHVLFGSFGSGLAAADRQVLSVHDFPALPPATLAAFGRALAIGDFDGDGDSDLAVGLPGVAFGAASAAGAVAEYHGGAAGLAPKKLWSQQTGGVKDKAESGDEFGRSLCTGDFDGDGRDDLAIGVLETVGGDNDAGAVHVLYGSKHGLSANGDQLWHQDRAGVKDQAELDDRFGSTLCAGDFDGDGRDELAIEIDNERRLHGADVAVSAVAILRGTNSGLSGGGDLLFDGLDLGGSAQAGFANALAAGDFDGDGCEELAVADAGFDVDGSTGAGMVHIVSGGVNGLDLGALAHWSQNSDNVPGEALDHELFGSALSVGDFDADGTADLAIGASLDRAGGGSQVGSALVLPGSSAGLTEVGATFWWQGDPSIAGAAESLDRFACALAAADLDGDGAADLAIGVRSEDIESIADAGALHVILGGPASGLHAGGSQLWFEDVLGGGAACAAHEEFACRLAQ